MPLFPFFEIRRDVFHPAFQAGPAVILGLGQRVPAGPAIMLDAV